MAVLATAVSSLSFQSKLLNSCPFSKRPHLLFRAGNQKISYINTKKLPTAEFRIPDKVKVQVDIAKECLWKWVPDSLRDYPWKKAADVFLGRLLFLSQKAFKWSFIAWFAFSFVLDFTFAVSRNRELVVPLGLLLGCLLTDWMAETSRELFPNSEVKDLSWHLVGIGCFCVVLKMITTSLAGQGRVLLLHVANGGLMQILWLWWRGLLEEKHDVC
ncbi:hypothetical protein Nepgr_005051 [Nepenthes gracilis]|uniref:Uncharacterized protein n=1 Tax=Nepenthes gracilis TaxID=150966 RepID=A0AAD3S2R3_NEPGR|nr:hypothetical protein Nepgr_005051 [Nepenthes gracilis]